MNVFNVFHLHFQQLSILYAEHCFFRYQAEYRKECCFYSKPVYII